MFIKKIESVQPCIIFNYFLHFKKIQQELKVQFWIFLSIIFNTAITNSIKFGC